MATCFLFVEHLSEEGCLCLKLNQQGEIDSSLEQRSFAEIQVMQANAQTFIVAPSQHFTLLKLALPWLAERKARAAIPFALEDKLAQNFDTLHYAFDNQHYQNGEYLVVVADKLYLQELIANLDSHLINFDLFTLDWFALKENELALLKSSLLVNDTRYQGALSPDLAPFYLKQWTDERVIFCFSDSDKNLFDLESLKLEEIAEPSYLWLAKRLEKTKPMNLCQGELQHGSSQNKTKRWYQAALAMSLLWLLTLLTINLTKLYFLNKDLNAVDEKIAVLYREFFPEAKQIISPKFRISQLLKTNQSTEDVNFWILLDKTAKTFQDNPLNVEQIRYQNQMLTLTLATKDFASLEEFQSKLQKEKVKVKQTQASMRDEQVVSTLELNL